MVRPRMTSHMQPYPLNPIPNIERGTFFLFAHWSAPCLRARDALVRAWSAAGLPASELHILDWDAHQDALRDLPELRGRVHGWGEAFHVRHGSIAHFQVLGRELKAVDREILSFLQSAADT